LFTVDEGVQAVRMARANIEKHLGREEVRIPPQPTAFTEPSGVFVTLNTYPGRELRGCIGYAEPIMPLGKALMDVSLAAAFNDPRFPPVGPKEMDRIVVEVTLLTPPEGIEYEGPEDLLKKVIIGQDGLIARKSYRSGLLLPQVPVEYGWDAGAFLSHTCLKAGLAPDEWKRGGVIFQRFSGKVFGERSPGGEIEELELIRG